MNALALVLAGLAKHPAARVAWADRANKGETNRSKTFHGAYSRLRTQETMKEQRGCAQRGWGESPVRKGLAKHPAARATWADGAKSALSPPLYCLRPATGGRGGWRSQGVRWISCSRKTCKVHLVWITSC